MKTCLPVLIVSLLLTPAAPATALQLGRKPPPVTLSGPEGGRIDGRAWSSEEIRGKIYVLFYVDPDEKGLNEHVEARLELEAFPNDRFGSIAVVNLAASWKPNWLIERILASKQKKFPRAIYVKDRVRKLVRTWQLADQSYNIVLFDKAGTVLFRRHGRLSPKATEQFIQLIKDRL